MKRENLKCEESGLGDETQMSKGMGFKDNLTKEVRINERVKWRIQIHVKRVQE